MKFSKQLSFVTVFMMVIYSILLVAIAAPMFDASPMNITSGWIDGVRIDGNFTTADEHSEATVISAYFSESLGAYSANEAYVYYSNDETSIFILYDICAVSLFDTSMSVYSYIDADNNNSMDYGDTWDGNDLFYGIYYDGSAWSHDLSIPIDESGFKAAIGFGESPNAEYNHLIAEFKIPISSLNHGNVALGDTIGAAAFSNDGGALLLPWGCEDNGELDNDVENYTKVTLAEDVVVQEAMYELVNTTGAAFILGSGVKINVDSEPRPGELEIAGESDDRLFSDNNPWMISIQIDNSYSESNPQLDIELSDEDGKLLSISEDWTSRFVVLIREYGEDDFEILAPTSQALTSNGGIYTVTLGEDSAVAEIMIASYLGWFDALFMSGWSFSTYQTTGATL